MPLTLGADALGERMAEGQVVLPGRALRPKPAAFRYGLRLWDFYRGKCHHFFPEGKGEVQ